jgi:hypothetical protein
MAPEFNRSKGYQEQAVLEKENRIRNECGEKGHGNDYIDGSNATTEGVVMAPELSGSKKGWWFCTRNKQYWRKENGIRNDCGEIGHGNENIDDSNASSEGVVMASELNRSKGMVVLYQEKAELEKENADVEMDGVVMTTERNCSKEEGCHLAAMMWKKADCIADGDGSNAVENGVAGIPERKCSNRKSKEDSRGNDGGKEEMKEWKRRKVRRGKARERRRRRKLINRRHAESNDSSVGSKS